MVEKIIISPESVRGLGNIVMPKTGADFRSVDCTVLVGTDTVNEETVTVFTLESDVTLLSVVLSVDDSSVVVGDTVTLSATVTDEMTQPVEGATVSFKLNGNVLGTSDTNSSGVATYSYTTVSDGTLVFSSVCSNNSSNSVNVTVTGHSYSLEFDSTDYTVIGGSVVIKVGLTDNSAVVPNVSVGLSGGGSSWSATTDTDGVATFNLSNVTTGGTYTASYGGATATCNVTIQTYLFYDDCTSDRSSEYSIITNSGWRTPSITYNSDGYYTVKTATSNSGNNGFYIGDISGLQDCKISMKLNRITTSGNRQIGLALWNTSNNYHIIGRFESTNNSMNAYAQTNSTNVFMTGSQTLSNSTWYGIEFIKQGNDYTLNCYDDSGTLLKTGSGTNTTFNNVSTLKPFIFLAWDGSKEFRVKDIKVEAV